MLTVKFSPTAPKSRLNKITAGITLATPTILNNCGLRLVGLARIYFDNLSKGGTGISGRKWPSLKDSTVAKRKSLARRGKLTAPAGVIGVVTGEMRQSLTYSIGGNSVKVQYEDPKARWFNVHRRLIPSVLPVPWRNQLDAIMQGQLDAVSSDQPVSRSRPRRSKDYGSHR